MNVCRICNTESKHKEYTVQEMMFGFNKAFIYFQCSNCHCLQIKDIPKDLTSYYPTDYYSFRQENNFSGEQNRIKKLLMQAHLHSKSGLPDFLKRYLPNKLSSLNGTRLKLNSKILDVGCGSGILLKKMHELGFSDLTGIDRYIESDKEFSDQLHIVKKDIYQMRGKFDFIMFHHSLEHMEDQLAVLRKAKELLADNGTVLFRIPTVSSYAWETYGVNWVELDAPRHFFLHSLESFGLLVKQAGFKIVKTEFDTTGFEILGSLQNEKGIPLRSPKSYSENLSSSIFSNKDISAAETQAKKLNKEKRAGRACFYLQRIT